MVGSDNLSEGLPSFGFMNELDLRQQRNLDATARFLGRLASALIIATLVAFLGPVILGIVFLVSMVTGVLRRN